MKRLPALFLTAFIVISQISFAQQQPSNASQNWVEETLKKLSLREKIGQMIMMRISGEFVNFDSDRFAETRQQILKNKIGGFVMFRGEANAISALTNQIQRMSDLPLLIAADYERGLRMGQRTGTPFTTNMGVAASGDIKAAYRQGKIVCEEMRAVGVNWLFAPVADVNNNADNPVINVRSYGENPQRVGEFASALALGAKDGNCLATLKHFPGHGDTATDSHIGLATIQADKQRLESLELIPFKMAIDHGADSVMTAHVALPNVTSDDIPATLNPKISNDILRKELKFDGIISTDAMEMGAIIKNYSEEKSVVMAVKAGADVVLLPLNAENAINAIEKAVKNGEITEERINESVRRLLQAKYRLGLTQNRFVDLAKVNQFIEKSENVRDANTTAEKSITLLRNAKDMLPLNVEKAEKTLFVILAADDEPEEGRAFVPEIQRRSPKAKIVRLDPRTTADEYAKVLADAQNYDSIVLAPFVKRAAGKGTVALPEMQTNFIKKMVGLDKNVAVIAFGSPYLIRQFPEAKVYVVTYAIEEVAQNAAVKAFFGESKFQGRLPVRIPNLFEIGAGIQK